MGIMARMARPREIFNDLSLTNPKAWNTALWNLRGSQSLSGESVDEYSALTYSAVFNAVTLISGTIGAFPLHLCRKKAKEEIYADEHPLFRIMYVKPNPLMTSMQFRETLMAHILTWGNGYAEIVRDGMGDVSELWPITPNRIQPYIEGTTLKYLIRVDNQNIIMPGERILHLAGLGFDGVMGYSIVTMARKSMGLGMAMETFGSVYFGNGTHPGVVVSHPGILKEPAKLRDSLTTLYSGLGQSHRLMLLEEGMKIEKVGIPPNDSQFLESRQFQIPEIARWFNLPPHKLKDLTRASFSNIESEQRSFLTDSILPWLVRLEQAYNTQLLTEKEHFKRKLYFHHNVEGILRADVASRGVYYREMFNIGGMTINEIREKEEMNPSSEDFADDHFVPLNMVPLSMLKEKLDKQNQPPPAPPAPAADPAADPNQPAQEVKPNEGQ